MALLGGMLAACANSTAALPTPAVPRPTSTFAPDPAEPAPRWLLQTADARLTAAVSAPTTAALATPTNARPTDAPASIPTPPAATPASQGLVYFWPGYIPQGWVVRKPLAAADATMFTLTLVNPDNPQLRTTIAGGAASPLPDNAPRSTSITIRSQRGVIINTGAGPTILWSENDAYYSIGGQLEPDMLVRFAESLRAYDIDAWKALLASAYDRPDVQPTAIPITIPAPTVGALTITAPHYHDQSDNPNDLWIRASTIVTLSVDNLENVAGIEFFADTPEQLGQMIGMLTQITDRHATLSWQIPPAGTYNVYAQVHNALGQYASAGVIGVTAMPSANDSQPSEGSTTVVAAWWKPPKIGWFPCHDG